MIKYTSESKASMNIACVRVNQEFTDLFATPSRVRQGDTLSAKNVFYYINDLFYEVDR